MTNGKHDLPEEDMPEIEGTDGQTDFPDITAQMQEVLAKLEQLETLEQELNSWKTKYARLYADFENYRRRTSEDVLEASSRGEAKAVEAILPVYDDLCRAIDVAVADPQTLIPGLRKVRENFLASLARLEIEEVPGKGALFDPEVHEALSSIPAQNEAEHDHIAEVFQTGFRLKGQLIRPARVVVAKK